MQELGVQVAWWRDRNGFEHLTDVAAVVGPVGGHVQQHLFPGHAPAVAVGKSDGDFVVVDRRRIELVEEEWAKQPYHAAEDLKPVAARDLVKHGVKAAQRIAVREMRMALKRERERENEVTACAVLVGNPMPNWSVEEILAVHFRMPTEGVCSGMPWSAPPGLCAEAGRNSENLCEHAERALELRRAPVKKCDDGKVRGPSLGRDRRTLLLRPGALQGVSVSKNLPRSACSGARFTVCGSSIFESMSA